MVSFFYQWAKGKKSLFHDNVRESICLENRKLPDNQDMDLVEVHKQQMILVTNQVWCNHKLVILFNQMQKPYNYPKCNIFSTFNSVVKNQITGKCFFLFFQKQYDFQIINMSLVLLNMDLQLFVARLGLLYLPEYTMQSLEQKLFLERLLRLWQQQYCFRYVLQ